MKKDAKGKRRRRRWRTVIRARSGRIRRGEEEEKKTKRVKRRRRRRRKNLRDDQKRRKKLWFPILQFFGIAACELVLRVCSSAEQNVLGRLTAWDTDWPAGRPPGLLLPSLIIRTVRFSYKLLTDWLDWLAVWLDEWLQQLSCLLTFLPIHQLTHPWASRSGSIEPICVCVCVMVVILYYR